MDNATAKDPAESFLAQQIIKDPTWKDIMFDRTRRRWMHYDAKAGIWREMEDDDLAAQVDKALTTLCKQGFSASRLHGVITVLKIRLGRTMQPPPRDLLPCRNGVLHLPTMTLQPHDSKHNFTWRLPYDFDPRATCQPVMHWLKDATGGDADVIALLRAYLRAILTRSVKVEKFLELLGPGGTGKGTFMRLATALVGIDNTHVTSLKLLEQSRFETVELIGKRLVLITDADRFTASVSTLNALTGDDTIRGERKFEPVITFRNECMIIVAANEPVQSPDYTSGLGRRRITVEFRHRPRVVRDLISFDDGQPTGELAASLPGILNWVLALDDAAMVACLRGHSSISLARTKAETLVATNPLAAWADACLVRGDAESKTYVGVANELPRGQGYERDTEWLYPNYCTYTQQANFQAVSLTRFSALLVDLLQFQLGQPDIWKGRDRDGAFITGIALRRPADGYQSFIADMLATQTRADTGRDDSVTTSTPGSVDCDDYVNLSINKSISSSPPYTYENAPHPSHPSQPTPERNQAITDPSRPVTTRVSPDKQPEKSRRTGDRWIFGKRRTCTFGRDNGAVP